jgi:nucleoside-diphosphate-sugar epimerase
MFWASNVRGTQRVLDAAMQSGVTRVILASSTSVYGNGSKAGERARMLEESTDANPEDVYDLTKLAAERILEHANVQGLDGIALRFGRFFFPSHANYHLRKLSTGLDVRDGCQAIVRAMLAPELPHRVYCVASDLPLTREQRERLGLDVSAVLEEVLPQFLEGARQRRVAIPHRVGKSVCSDAARADLGYCPERTLEWVGELWCNSGGDEVQQIQRSHVTLAHTIPVVHVAKNFNGP